MKRIVIGISLLILLAMSISSCGSSAPCPVYADTGHNVVISNS